MKEPMTLQTAFNTTHREEILVILSVHSSRMRYRRANLESFFKKVGLDVKFTTADMKEVIKTNKINEELYKQNKQLITALRKG